jgi:hypothetical protein
MVASAKLPERALTSKQELFARLVAEGKGMSESYRIAYQSKSNPAAVRSDAWKLATDPRVERKIAELKARAEERMFLTRSRKRHILYQIAETPKNKATDRIKAIEVDNRMSGDDAAIKIEGDITLLSALGQLKQAEPVIELETRVETPALPVSNGYQQTETNDPEIKMELTVSPEPSTPAVPFDSSPFGEQAPVFTPASDSTPVKLTRTRSYDE